MTFEKALEAMKQGKTVKRNSNEKVEYFIRNDTGEITAFFYDRLNPFSRIALYSCELLADDWEICRESNKEENELSSSVKLLSDFAKSLQFDLGNTAMRTINSYQISDIVSALKTVLDYAKSTIKLAYLKNQEDKETEMTAEHAIESLEMDTEPEHKCNACHCNCSHTGKNSDLQVKMEQALSRKFFELADTTTDSLAVSNMIEIYRLLFEVK